MVLWTLLAAALGAQAGPPAQPGPPESFIVCPGNPRCPRNERDEEVQESVSRARERARSQAVGALRSTVRAPPRIYFAPGNDVLDEQARAVLDEQAHWLILHPAFSATVEGHSDPGTEGHAGRTLGERRAVAARDYLVARGVAAGRLTAISFGAERPALYDSGESVSMMNRRVEIRIRD